MPRWIVVILCLIAGFVLSVAVSWLGAGFAANPGTAPMTAFVPSSPIRADEVRPPRDIQRMFSPAVSIVAVDPMTNAARGWLVQRKQHRIRVLNSAGWFEFENDDKMSKVAAGSPAWIDVYASGWPLAALEWTDAPLLNADLRDPQKSKLNEAWGRAWEFGFDYAGTNTQAWSPEMWRRLPVRASRGGLGLVVDTIVWGVLVWPLVGAGRAVKRRRRRRRGLCVGCGYPVRDAGGGWLQQCPECGTVVKPTPLPPSMPETGSSA